MKRSLVAVAATASLLLTACGSSGSSDSTDGAGGAGRDASVSVTAAFYPLAYAVERVGGDRVAVTNLSKPGAEPHDLELTPKDVASLGRSDLVVYETGFQPAVDEAIKQRGDTENTLDVATAVDLTIPATEDGHDHGHSHEGESADAESHGDEHADEHADQPAVDPHFWLDPTRYAKAVTAISDKLAAIDPEGATAYKENAEAFNTELATLDRDFAAGLKTCANRELVTGHLAFAYLAARYDLHQEGIAGISPDSEPDAATMKQIVDLIRSEKVTTIYAETLANKDLTETIGRETGATVAVLDPIEGLSDESAGKNYVEIMRSNLATLQKGQQCQ